jgi:alkanesulfonate monooxygenase SsuD/methylene tetrahydromethanopterin reductase-like flavin-dependent oxidoreductase (luciferase family)
MALWRGGLVHHDGPHYRMPALHFEPRPAEPIPILIGGASRPALERAARRGDGFVAAPSTVDDLIDQAAQIRRLREELGVAERPFSFRARSREVGEVDEYRRLIDAGIDSFVIPALGGSREEVERKLDDAVTDVLLPLRSSGHLGVDE